MQRLEIFRLCSNYTALLRYFTQCIFKGKKKNPLLKNPIKHLFFFSYYFNRFKLVTYTLMHSYNLYPHTSTANQTCNDTQVTFCRLQIHPFQMMIQKYIYVDQYSFTKYQELRFSAGFFTTIDFSHLKITSTKPSVMWRITITYCRVEHFHNCKERIELTYTILVTFEAAAVLRNGPTLVYY